MGRKKKVKIGPVDRIGEPLNLEKCPECVEHPDCFSCIEGRCTALNECRGQGCVFYKPYEIAVKQIHDTYQKLKGEKRYDLIAKYRKTLIALGVEDAEFADGFSIMEELDAFATANYEAQLRDVMEAEREGDV